MLKLSSFGLIVVCCLGLSARAGAQEPPAAVPPAPADPLPPEPAAEPDPAAAPESEAAPTAGDASPTATPPSAADAEGAPAEEPEPDWPLLTFKARLMTGFEIEREHPEGPQPATDETQAELFLEQAVLEVEAVISKRIEMELGFNLRNQTIRDAFLNYRVHDAFQLRVGRFKRPFSRLELRSRGKLPFRDRGIYNNIVLSDNGFAGRSLGGMIWGKPNDQLRYYLAAASPTEIGSGIEGVDLLARVTYEPIPMISIGVNGMHKWSERFADGEDLSVSAFGADARFEYDPFELTLEFDAAQNPAPPPAPGATDPSRTPWALGFIAWAEFAFKVSKKWTLGPVVVFEWLDTDTEYGEDERIRAVGGLSWNYRKNALRVMPQVEIIRPIGRASTRGAVASETYYVMVSSDI